MKKILLLLFYFFFSANQFCFSQSWAPIGATWYYTVYYFGAPGYGYMKIESVGDTLINGKVCSTIKYVDGENALCSFPGYLPEVYSYSDSGRIFVYETTNNAFSLILDFNLDTGQTYTTTWDTCSYQFTINSKDSINLNGYWLRRYRLLQNGFTYIENIGGAEIFLSCLPDYTCTGLIVDANHVNGLRCYYDSTIGFVDFDTLHACDYSTVGIPELNSQKLFSLSPNPFQNLITIKNNQQKDLSITIFSSIGEVVHQATLIKDAATTINLSGLAAGIYLVAARSDKNFVARKIVKE